jgi:dienelactone hydrolase
MATVARFIQDYTMRTLLLLAACLFPIPCIAADPDPAKVFPSGEKCTDSRLGKAKDLNGYFPFNPPASKDSWNDRSRHVREQMMVATGLWPMPVKTPLNPVIHGKIERDSYTIEKVFFASMPGHYVSGNLYRPTAKADGKRPGVLCPHGHWKNGRFYDAGEAEAKKQIEQGAEKTIECARYPLQARCAQLTRMGCVVFHYDMIGVADSKAIPHTAGFLDAEAELRSQSFMGLQTWNNIRSLDFISSLDDVDPKRVGVTGASGGGTQTFMLCAIDDRPAVAFPAVMVSTAMQGGCVCENCSHLRVGTGNVEFAALFAPKPLAMSGANDWTIDIEKKGLPELKKLYKTLDAEDKVAAKCFAEFGHNYNQVSREYMYNWFNTHLLHQKGQVSESAFKPVPPDELSVYDNKHPRPKGELNAETLRKTMTEAAEKQIAALTPKDAKSLAEYQHVIGTALKIMVHDQLPGAADVALVKGPVELKLADGEVVHQATITRRGASEAIPVIGVVGKEFDGTMVLWIHPQGKASLFENGALVPAAREILNKKAAIMAADVFQTGELVSENPLPVNAQFAGFTYGYNRSVFAQRVHDILTAIRFAHSHPARKKQLQLVGWGKAGPWVAAARALAGDLVDRTAIDMNQFRFDTVRTTSDEMMLPGAMKFGGLPSFVVLCAPHEIMLHDMMKTMSGQLSKAAYAAAGADDKLKRVPTKMKESEVVEWLLR